MKQTSKEAGGTANFLISVEKHKTTSWSHGGKIQMKWKTAFCHDLPLSNDILYGSYFTGTNRSNKVSSVK